MSVSSQALNGFFIKCGVGEDYSSVVAKFSGDLYLQFQSNARMQGLGSSSKAVGAIAAAETIIDDYLENGFSPPIDKYADHFISACVKIYSAAICILAALSYQNDLYSEQVVNEFIKKADEAFDFIEACTESELLRDKKRYYQGKLHSSAPEVIAVAKALGNRKGVWSKIFG